MAFLDTVSTFVKSINSRDLDPSKHSDLSIELREFKKEAQFQDMSTKNVLPANTAAYVVKNNGKGSTHVVFGSINPFDGALTFWCASETDPMLRESFASFAKSDPCHFWRGKSCKHVGCVVTEILGNSILAKELEKHLYNLGPAIIGSKAAGNVLEFLRSALFYGPTGSGKTHSVVMQHVADLKDKGLVTDSFLVACSDGMEDLDLLSKTIPLAPEARLSIFRDLSRSNSDLEPSVIASMIGDWGRTDGPLRKAFLRAKNGEKIAIVLDEVSRAGVSARNLVLKAMDPVLGEYVLDDFTTGEQIHVPIDNLKWIATCNLGSAYSQASQLDEAFLDRFDMVSFVDYNPAIEERIMKEAGLAEDIIGKIQNVVKVLRHAYLQGNLPSPFSTRLLKVWIAGITRGFGPIEYAETWINRIVEKDERGYPDAGHIETIQAILKSELS